MLKTVTAPWIAFERAVEGRSIHVEGCRALRTRLRTAFSLVQVGQQIEVKVNGVVLFTDARWGQAEVVCHAVDERVVPALCVGSMRSLFTCRSSMVFVGVEGVGLWEAVSHVFGFGGLCGGVLPASKGCGAQMLVVLCRPPLPRFRTRH